MGDYVVASLCVGGQVSPAKWAEITAILDDAGYYERDITEGGWFYAKDDEVNFGEPPAGLLEQLRELKLPYMFSWDEGVDTAAGVVWWFPGYMEERGGIVSGDDPVILASDIREALAGDDPAEQVEAVRTLLKLKVCPPPSDLPGFEIGVFE